MLQHKKWVFSWLIFLLSQLPKQRRFGDGGFVGRNTKSGAWWVSLLLTLSFSLSLKSMSELRLWPFCALGTEAEMWTKSRLIMSCLWTACLLGVFPSSQQCEAGYFLSTHFTFSTFKKQKDFVTLRANDFFFFFKYLSLSSYFSVAIPRNLFESNTFVSTCVFTFVISDISWNIEGHQ